MLISMLNAEIPTKQAVVDLNLMEAALDGSAPGVEAALAAGANVNAEDDFGDTPMLASLSWLRGSPSELPRRAAIIERLLSAWGAHPQRVGDTLEAALHCVSALGDDEWDRGPINEGWHEALVGKILGAIVAPEELAGIELVVRRVAHYAQGEVARMSARAARSILVCCDLARAHVARREAKDIADALGAAHAAAGRAPAARSRGARL